MSARQSLVDDLIRDEGLLLHPYMDSVGKITIGVGRNLSDVGISNGEAMVLLDHDLDAAIADLVAAFPWFATMDDVRQRAIVNARFNLGPTRFRTFKRMIRLLEEHDYPAAAMALRESLWYTQVKSRGVRLVAMLRTGEDA